LSRHTPHPFFQSLERPASPNNWLIAPEDFVPAPDEVSPVFPVPDRVLKSEIIAAVHDLERVRQEHVDGDLMRFVMETRLFRFKDDLTIQVIALDRDRSTFAAYSASRVGYWDLGKNRNRLRKLSDLLRARLARTSKG
jgi:hypothetical protein